MKNLIILFVLSLAMFNETFSQTGAIELPATGQTVSYYPGDDGDLQKGSRIPEDRFIVHDNGTATDKLTGLMWVTDGNLIASRDPDFDQDRTPGDGDINWKTALDYIEKLNNENYLGYNDWRMPNALELRSLVNLGKDSVTFPDNHPFTNLKEGYWSSTTVDGRRGAAINVYLLKYVLHANKTYPAGDFQSINKDLGNYISYYVLYLLPVRNGEISGKVELPKSGQTFLYYSGDDADINYGTLWPSPRLVDNKDSSVTDRLTGLMWTKNMTLMFDRDPDFYDEHGSSWESALDYIAKLNAENYLGYSDWRLPNRNELTSLIDYNCNHLDLPKNHPFVNIGYSYGFWTSTTVADVPEKAWVYYFSPGNLYDYEKTIEENVWAVRTDNSDLPSGSINGKIEGVGVIKNGIEVTIKGTINARTETMEDGSYIFTGLPDGNYTVTPSHLYYTFTPEIKTVNISNSSVSCDFTVGLNESNVWIDISPNLFPYGNAAGANLTDVYFINDDEGWITNGFNAEIYHTTDGGETFEIQNTQYSTNAIHMLNKNEGYAGGEVGHIFRTTDGGENWIAIESISVTLTDISFPPAGDTGYACAMNGSVWEITSDGVTNLNCGSYSNFSGISSSSVDNFWVCGGNRIYYYNGADFTSQAGLGGYYNDIHFVNDRIGWVVGDSGYMSGTSDGGDIWFTLRKPDSNESALLAVHSPNGKDVWAVGWDGIILHLSNGNDFYNAVLNIEGAGLTNALLGGVFFTSETNGYAVGNNGTLLKYQKIITEVKEQHQPQKFILEQNYPNPFNPSTKIKYTIPRLDGQASVEKGHARSTTNVILRVYDILGREVTTLVNKEQLPGTYEVEFSSSSLHLVSGVYFYQLKNGKFIETKKMLLLK